jgi:hypothetical protein
MVVVVVVVVVVAAAAVMLPLPLWVRLVQSCTKRRAYSKTCHKQRLQTRRLWWGVTRMRLNR